MTKEIEMDYEAAETAGYDRQENDGTPTLAQWARAEALKAVLSQPVKSMTAVEDMVNMYAELIVTGSLPRPKPGTSY